MAAPLLCMYLFLDERGGTLPPHPSRRTRSPLRYLECALVQAASLRLREVRCDLVLVTNAKREELPGRRGRRLWEALQELGVRRLETAFRPAAGSDPDACRFPRTALLAIAGEADERTVWLPNLDCVWVEPERALAAAPAGDRVGCLSIGYPPEWRVGGPAAIGDSRQALAATVHSLGGPDEPPPWVGADLLAGSAGALRALFASCDELEARLRRQARASNEQLLTLACALGLARAEELSAVARRIQTGARHGGATPQDAAALGIWHLPAEKGLSLRRSASELLRGGGPRLLADLEQPTRAMARFNVRRPGLARRVRDEAWVLAGRLGAG